MDELLKYFPDLSDDQKDKFSRLYALYSEWNSRINVISRKDMDNFYIHHVLHSLAIAKFIFFMPGTEILDVGTGGGFPGIPLAIFFRESQFTLLDSIGKKIKVVTEVAGELGLPNVTAINLRAEDHSKKYDFVISRAVTAFPEFVKITLKNLRSGGKSTLPNGIIYLKGGDLDEELNRFTTRVSVKDLKDYFSEPFFETKKIVYLPA
jgi:16S rRNA (guanine527-N7)-methyltransferase